MEHPISPIAQKLMHAFMQFDKAEWHERTIEGCTPGEIRLLFCIRKGIGQDAPTLKVSEISKRLHVTSPSVTQMLKDLEAKGLVARHSDPTDRRTVGIALTTEGEAVVQKAHHIFVTSFHGLIGYLGEEESNHLAYLLAKVFRYFNETAASAHRSTYEATTGAHQSDWNGEEHA